MELITVFFHALGFVLGSCLLAAGMSAAGWGICSLVGHPEAGSPIVLLVIISAVATGRVDGGFLKMVGIFAVIVAPFAWVEAKAWRANHGADWKGRCNVQFKPGRMEEHHE